MLLDYRRTEAVQYEDDEYYYYVKAVPKVTAQVLAEEGVRTNRANAGRRPAPSRGRVPAQGRGTSSGRVPAQGHVAGTPGRTTAGAAARPTRAAGTVAGEKRAAVRSYQRPETAPEEYNES